MCKQHACTTNFCAIPRSVDADYRYYRQHHRIFPYHLGHYVCRVLRVSPFKYYSDMCYSSLAAELSFSELPNFTVSLCTLISGVECLLDCPLLLTTSS